MEKISEYCDYPIVNGKCGMCGNKNPVERENRPFYIVQYEIGNIMKDNLTIEDFNIIKVLNDKILDLSGGIIKIDSKFYRRCSLNYKLNYLAVEEIKEPEYEEELFQMDEITCPACGTEKSDSWEYSDENNLICDTCGSEYSYSRIVEVSYTSNIVKLNKDIKEL